MTQMTTAPSKELTLRDLLSRLTYTRACRWLGPDGARWIREGGEIEVELDQVDISANALSLRLPDAVATITRQDDAAGKLTFSCSTCNIVCRHVGAVMALVLEEKTALGFAAPPPERVPVEALSEAALVQQALLEREERARTERMQVRSTDATRPWTDYTVTNKASGKTYRVALRGMERGDSYCSCPDFKKNGLGTCKHVLHVLGKMKRRFPNTVLRKPYRRRHLAVHVRYGQEAELHLLMPPKVDPDIARVVKPILDRPIADERDLLQRIQTIERLGQEVLVYPDAMEIIESRLFRRQVADLVAEIRRDPEAHPLRKKLLKTELLPYQLDGIAFAVGAGRAVLADDMGLGKTIQAVGAAELFARVAGIQRVLVIAPASLKSQWKNEVQRFCSRDVRLIHGSAAERVDQYRNGCFFTICNYEQVLRDILAIERVPFDLIVLDEAQRIKNWEAKTSQVIKGLRSRFALVLTGTPIENRLEELHSIVEFVDERHLGPQFRFHHRHRVVDANGRVLGYKDLASLRKRLEPVLLRRTRQEVLGQLPKRTTEVLRIEPTEEQADLHRAQMMIVRSILRKHFLTEMDLLRLRKALLFCRLAADGTFLVDKQRPGYSSKLERLENLLDELFRAPERKAVLFSEWIGMLDAIEPLLRSRKLGYVRLDGKVPQKQRQALVQTFQRDAGCRLFLTTNAGSTGLNLQAADTVLNMDLPWNPAVLEQRIGRAHRMGQKRPVQVYLFVTEQTIEESLLDTLSAKHELFLAALDPDSEVDAVDLVSGAEELKARLEVLLGRAPDAALDQSVERGKNQEAAAIASSRDAAAAGGALLSKTFRLLSKVATDRPETSRTKATAARLREQLRACLTPSDDGRHELRLTLAGPEALDEIAATLARLVEHRA